jgi:hypothetical protein
VHLEGSDDRGNATHWPKMIDTPPEPHDWRQLCIERSYGGTRRTVARHLEHA